MLLELGVATNDAKLVTEAKGLLESVELPLIARERDRAVKWLAAR